MFFVRRLKHVLCGLTGIILLPLLSFGQVSFKNPDTKKYIIRFVYSNCQVKHKKHLQQILELTWQIRQFKNNHE
jgi:hypothetical protein